MQRHAASVGLTAAPVDLVFPEYGIRVRHVPGVVDLAARCASAPDPVTPGPALRDAINSVAEGNPSGLVPLKIDRIKGPFEGCGCGGTVEHVLADLALGPNLGLVVEAVDALFCFSCGEMRFADDGAGLRSRLARWHSASSAPDHVEPSLRYETDPHPRAVQIEVTTRCNLACAYCSNPLLVDPADAASETLERIIERIDFAEVDLVDFTGLGEPTLHRDLPRVVAEIARRGPHLSLRVVSNAVSGSPARWRTLIEAGLGSIAFSLDTLDPDRFARQRGNASLEKALRTVTAVAALRVELGRPAALRIKAVLLDHVYQEAEALMRWSIEAGLNMPHFSTLDRRDGAQDLYSASPWLTHALTGEGEAYAFDRWVRQFWTDHGGRLEPPAAPPRRYRHPKLLADRKACRWVKNAAYVAMGGDMLTCCESMIDVPRQFVGSIAEKSLGESWRDELLWTYRLPLSVGLPPRGCVGCPQAASPS